MHPLEVPSEPLGDAHWQAIVARRPADFVYGVVTTGIVCRTTCPARPARKNVRVFDDAAAALAAGFRACLRCKPLASPAREEAARVAGWCAILDRWVAEEAGNARPRLLEMLAEESGLSRYTVQRLFVRTLGISPQDYVAARRIARLDAALAAPRTKTVTEAIVAAGFGASSRFYETGSDRLGMQATTRKRGGEGMEIHVQFVVTSLGLTLVAATARGICALLFGDEGDEGALREDLHRRFPKAHISTAETTFVAPWMLATIASVEEGEVAQELPLDLRGTVFQERVWQALRAIPRGTTVTYSELAALCAAAPSNFADARKRTGLPTRAVATACGANPIAVLVPCHRVVGKGGTGLRGYRWGLGRKAMLLSRETNAFSDPASRRAETNAISDPASRRAETNAFSDPASRRAETIGIPPSGECASIAGDEELGGAGRHAPPRRRG